MILISIKKRFDFLSLSDSDIRFHSKSCLVLAKQTPEKYLLNPHTKKINNFCRFGLTASKKTGKAVIRNKVKRRLRAALVKIDDEQFVNHFDYSIIAKKEITKHNFNKIYDDLKFCLKHIKRLIAQQIKNNANK